MALAFADHFGPWTEEDFLALPEHACAELLDGALLVSPPPAPGHQEASWLLTGAIRGQLTGPDLMVVEGVGVRVSPNSTLIPDVLALDRDAARLNRSGIVDAGIVRLVVEIVSPGSRTMDRITKPSLYARAGIPHYWRVELTEGPAIVAYQLQGDTYQEVAHALPGQPLMVTDPFPMTIDPALLRQ